MSGQDILQELRQAVFRVTENGESMYFSVPKSVELLQAAAHLRNYLSGENAGKFTAIFPHGEKITQEQFDAAAAERMENTGCIAGAYELDFDARTFSARRPSRICTSTSVPPAMICASGCSRRSRTASSTLCAS